MNKALTGYRRQVRDDGVIGSEIVVALLGADPAAACARTAHRGAIDDLFRTRLRQRESQVMDALLGG